MSEERTIVKEIIEDGVKITEYSDGTTEFTAIKQPVKSKSDDRNFIQKTIDWYKNCKIKPVIKVVDMNKPEKKRWWDERDAEPVDDNCYKEKPSVFVGIKMEF